MEKGDSVRVKKQQTRVIVDYLKSNSVKPLSEGKIISIINSNGSRYVMVEIINTMKIISLPDSAVESVFADMGGLDNPFGDIFGDIFKGRK